MTETDWIEGKGLTDGWPDPNWSNRAVIRSWPDETGWNISIVWGSTWGHYAVGRDFRFDTAMAEAVMMATNMGCPEKWLPRVPFDESAAATKKRITIGYYVEEE